MHWRRLDTYTRTRGISSHAYARVREESTAGLVPDPFYNRARHRGAYHGGSQPRVIADIKIRTFKMIAGGVFYGQIKEIHKVWKT